MSDANIIQRNPYYHPNALKLLGLIEPERWENFIQKFAIEYVVPLPYGQKIEIDPLTEEEKLYLEIMNSEPYKFNRNSNIE